MTWKRRGEASSLPAPRVEGRGCIFTYAVETERRFDPCNAVDLEGTHQGGDAHYEVSMGCLGLGHCTVVWSRSLRRC